MRIELIFDTVCPWCYVGVRRLHRALSLRPDVHPHLAWRPFLLNPDIPTGGIERRAYLDRRFGGPVRAERIHAAVAAAGRDEGIDFHFERINRTPNTLMSHRLIRFAAGSGREYETVEALYDAYFCHGIDIGHPTELLRIADSLGLPIPDAANYLLSEVDVAAVLNDNARAHRLGINGVPCVIFDGLYAIAGAQDLDVLMRLIDLARENAVEPAFSQMA